MLGDFLGRCLGSRICQPTEGGTGPVSRRVFAPSGDLAWLFLIVVPFTAIGALFRRAIVGAVIGTFLVFYLLLTNDGSEPLQVLLAGLLMTIVPFTATGPFLGRAILGAEIGVFLVIYLLLSR